MSKEEVSTIQEIMDRAGVSREKAISIHTYLITGNNNYLQDIMSESKLTKSQKSIVAAFLQANGNISEAARILGKAQSNVSNSWNNIKRKKLNGETANYIINFINSECFAEALNDNHIYNFVEDYLDREYLNNPEQPIQWNERRMQKVMSDSNTTLIRQITPGRNRVLELKCSCGRVFERKWQQALKDTGFKCNFCSGKIIWNTELIKEWASDNNLEFLSEYKYSMDTYSWKCSCGEIFERTFSNMHSEMVSTQCPKCAPKSKGEQKIQDYLEDNNISYVSEAMFDDLINPKTEMPLRFDFYVPEHNTVIEFHGIQHYESSEFFGGEEELIYLQWRDNYKKEYAISNGMRYLEIPYNEIDMIDNILDKAI